MDSARRMLHRTLVSAAVVGAWASGWGGWLWSGVAAFFVVGVIFYVWSQE